MWPLTANFQSWYQSCGSPTQWIGSSSKRIQGKSQQLSTAILRERNKSSDVAFFFSASELTFYVSRFPLRTSGFLLEANRRFRNALKANTHALPTVPLPSTVVRYSQPWGWSALSPRPFGSRHRRGNLENALLFFFRPLLVVFFLLPETPSEGGGGAELWWVGGCQHIHFDNAHFFGSL